MVEKRQNDFAGLRIPDRRGVVGAAGHHARTVRAEPRLIDLVGMAVARHKMAIRDLPHACHSILAGRDQPLAVGTELGEDHLGLVTQHKGWAAGTIHTPEPRRRVFARGDQ